MFKTYYIIKMHMLLINVPCLRVTETLGVSINIIACIPDIKVVHFVHTFLCKNFVMLQILR